MKKRWKGKIKAWQVTVGVLLLALLVGVLMPGSAISAAGTTEATEPTAPYTYESAMEALAALEEEALLLPGMPSACKAFHDRLMDVYVSAWESYDSGLIDDPQIEEIDAKTIAIETILMEQYGFDPYDDAATYGAPSYSICYPNQNDGTYVCYWTQYEGSWCAKFYSNNDWVRNAWVVENDDTWYYFNNDGYLVTGAQKIDGVTYKFRDDGVMYREWGPVSGDGVSWGYYKNNRNLYNVSNNMTPVTSVASSRLVGLDYSYVILGAQSAKSVESNASKLGNSCCTQSFTSTGTYDITSGYGCGLGDCAGATVYARYGNQGSGGSPNDYSKIVKIDGGDYFWVMYHNVAKDANGKPICLEMAVYDYAIGSDVGITPRIGFTTTRGTDGNEEYVKDKAPGVSATNIAWVSVEYNFYTHNGNGDTAHNWNDVTHSSIAVKGSTSYYDVDGLQGVHLHENSTDHVIATSNSVLKCNTPDGTPPTGKNGPFVYCGQKVNDAAYTTAYAFTEEFSVAKGSPMYRTFVYRNGGGMYHDPDPVVKGSASVTKSVSSGSSADDSKAFTFTAELYYNNSKVNFPSTITITGANSVITAPANNSTAKFTLKKNQRATFNNLPQGAVVKIAEESPGNNYTVSNNGVSVGVGGSATITNTRKTGTLVVKKSVVDGASVDTGRSYSFSATLKDGSTTLWTQSFSLKNGETKTFSNVPTGAVLTVTENDYSGNGITTTNSHGSGRTGTVTANTGSQTVTFTNTRDTGSVTVTKKVSGVTTSKTYPITVTDVNGKTYSVSLANGGSHTFTKVPTGKITVSEDTSSAGVTGYTLSVSGTGQYSVSKGKTTNVTVTNAYARDKGSLKLTKSVKGITTGAEPSFSFTVTDKDGGKHTATLSKSNNYTVTLNNIPTGSAKIEEATAPAVAGHTFIEVSNGSNKTYTRNVDIDKNNPASVTYTNTYTRDKGAVEVTKVVSGLSSNLPAANVPKNFSVSVAKHSSGGAADFGSTKNGTVNVGSPATFKDIPTGNVKVSESVTDAIQVDNYTLTVTYSDTDQVLAVEKDKTAKITVYNTYTRQLSTAKVKKVVNSTSSADSDKIFSFKATLWDYGVQIDFPSDMTIANASVKSGSTAKEKLFDMKDGTEVTFGKLPKGAVLKVEEINPGDVYTVSGSPVEVTVGSATAGVITNTRKDADVTVKKEVTGDIIRNNDAFSFEATLMDQGKAIAFSENGETTLRFTLKNGEEKVIQDLPVNAVLTVVETTDNNYTTSTKVGSNTADSNTVEYTVLQSDNEKIVFINNLRRSSATVTKQVENEVDPDKTFNFSATLFSGDQQIAFPEAVTVTGATYSFSNDRNTITFSLKDDMTATFDGLPVTAVLKVQETLNSNYGTVNTKPDTAAEADSGSAALTVTADQSVAVTYTNTRLVSDVTVRKNTIGSTADAAKTFAFTATLWDIGDRQIAFPASVGLIEGVTLSADQKTVTFSLADDQSVKLTNLYSGSTLKVEEAVVEEYTVTHDGADGVSAEKLMIPGDNGIIDYVNTRKTADVTLKKEVTGGIIHEDQEFVFTATLFDGNEQVQFPQAVKDAATVSSDGMTATITLKHNETFVFEDLYADAVLKVEETENPDYITTSKAGDNSAVGGSHTYTVKAADNDTIVYTNQLRNSKATVTKQIENEVDEEKTFIFTATLFNGDQQMNFPESVTVSGADIRVERDRSSISFCLGDGQTATFDGLPVTATLKIEETTDGNYATTNTVEQDSATATMLIETGKTAHVTYTNRRLTGEVTVDKTVEQGSTADATKPFSFTATLWDTGDRQTTFPESAASISGVTLSRDRMTATFQLTDGQSVTFADLYAGTTFKVEETVAAFYTTVSDPDPAQKLVVSGESEQIHFVNTRMLTDVTVVKQNTGHIIHPDQEFTFTATLFDGDTQIAFPSGEMTETFKLRHTKNFTFEDIYAGATLKITETAHGDYTTTNTHGSGVNAEYFIKASDNDTIIYTNALKNSSAEITKLIKNEVDQDKTFVFTATLFNGDKQIDFPMTVQANGLTFSEDRKTATFVLGNDDSMVMAGLPVTSTLKIVETLDENYTTTNTVEAGSAEATLKIIADVPALVTYVNTRGSGDVTVSKTLLQGSSADAARAFTFTATLWDTGDRQTTFPAHLEQIEGVTLNSDRTTATFKLLGGQQVTLTDLYAGTTVKVEETPVEFFTVQVTPDPAQQLVVGDEEKTIDFTNTRLLADVAVKKVVEGHVINTERAFTFTATLWDGNMQVKFPSGEMTETFQLKHNETYTFEDLFVGARLSLIETDDMDFITTNTHGKGTTASYVVQQKDNETVVYTNTIKTAPVTVTKTVKGGIIDKEKEFRFDATLWYGDNQIAFPKEIGKGFSVSDDRKTISFLLRDGEEAVIQAMPIGVVLKVSEAADPDYSTVNNFAAGCDAQVSVNSTNGKIIRYENTLRNTQITVTKEVTGNMGDQNHPFSFTITMKDKYGKDVAFTVPSGVAYDAATNTASFTLKDGQSVTFTDVPIGAQVVVDEEERDYKATGMLNDKNITGLVNNGKFKFTVEDAQTDILEVTNEKNVSLDTGIAFDGMPFVLILVLAAAGCAFLVLRKRKVEE